MARGQKDKKDRSYCGRSQSTEESKTVTSER